MFYILDLRTTPHSIVPNLVFSTEQEAIQWIDQNGGIIIFSIHRD